MGWTGLIQSYSDQTFYKLAQTSTSGSWSVYFIAEGVDFRRQGHRPKKVRPGGVEQYLNSTHVLLCERLVGYCWQSWHHTVMVRACLCCTQRAKGMLDFSRVR